MIEESKKKILNQHNFEIGKGDIYFNRKTKKVFTPQFITDNNENRLIDKIKENNSDWEFYSSNHISDSIKRDILKDLGEIR